MLILMTTITTHPRLNFLAPSLHQWLTIAVSEYHRSSLTITISHEFSVHVAAKCFTHYNEGRNIGTIRLTDINITFAPYKMATTKI